MPKDARIIEISEIGTPSELLQLAEEVRATGVTTVLCRNGENLVELRPARAIKKSRQKSKVFDRKDPLWGIVGIVKDNGGPGDVSSNVDKYLADAYLDPHQ